MGIRGWGDASGAVEAVLLKLASAFRMDVRSLRVLEMWIWGPQSWARRVLPLCAQLLTCPCARVCGRVRSILVAHSKWHRVAHAQGLCRRWSVHFLSFFLYVRTVRIYQSREVQANKARSEAQDTCVHDNG